MNTISILRASAVGILATISLGLAAAGVPAQSPLPSGIIWFDEPAARWIEALPVGNGRMGAMVFGGVAKERIQLNEDTIWAGAPEEVYRRGSPEDLKRIREDLQAGKEAEVSAEIMAIFSAGSLKRSHQTLRDLKLQFKSLGGDIQNYRRELDLNTGVVTTRFQRDGAWEQRRVFASYPYQVIVVQLESQHPSGLHFEAKLTHPKDQGQATVRIETLGRSTLLMTGQVTNRLEKAHGNGAKGVMFCCELAAKNSGGTSISTASSIVVEGARSVTLWIAVTTDFENPLAPARLDPPRGLLFPASPQLRDARIAGLQQVSKQQLADHQRLFDRVNLDLGHHPARGLPTDERLTALKKGANDPDLCAILFQFGRYLLIASSRPGSQPANLQGLWNQHINAPWNADYHLNINLQMNYWPVEITNLAECAEPLFDYVAKLAHAKTSAVGDG
ncbi:MAG: glycoside hydrolase family 95 protein [Planctomycetota bacterium]